MTQAVLARSLVVALLLSLVTTAGALAAELTFLRLAPDGGVAESIPVLFNPAEFSVKKTVPWDRQRKGKGWELPKLPSPRTLHVALEYDAAPAGVHVDDLLMPLLSLAEPDPAQGRPPTVRLVWGDGLRITGVLEQLDVTYSGFRPDGVPVRATVKVTLQESLPDSGPGLRR